MTYRGWVIMVSMDREHGNRNIDVRILIVDVVESTAKSASLPIPKS